MNIEKLLLEIAAHYNTTVLEIREEIEKVIDISWNDGSLKKLKLFKSKPSLEEYFFKISMYVQLKNILT